MWDGRERDGASVGTQGAEYLGRKRQGSCTEKCHIHGVGDARKNRTRLFFAAMSVMLNMCFFPTFGRFSLKFI